MRNCILDIKLQFSKIQPPFCWTQIDFSKKTWSLTLWLRNNEGFGALSFGSFLSVPMYEKHTVDLKWSVFPLDLRYSSETQKTWERGRGKKEWPTGRSIKDFYGCHLLKGPLLSRYLIWQFREHNYLFGRLRSKIKIFPHVHTAVDCRSTIQICFYLHCLSSHLQKSALGRKALFWLATGGNHPSWQRRHDSRWNGIEGTPLSNTNVKAKQSLFIYEEEFANI